MKSPLKDKPLRNPGQTIDQRIDDLVYDQIYRYLVVSLWVVMLVFLEWWRWYKDIPPAPITYTIFALLFIGFSIWKVARAIRQLQPLKQGRDGEKAVGQYLERLRESGAKVFHDIPAKDFNLDHVVVAKSGAYIVETKSYSKPDKGEAIVSFDGEKVYLNGMESKSNPITQVKAATNWLRQMLKESTGKEFQLRSVVLFPGWFIQSTAEAKSSEVWVLNPKALPAFIMNSKNKHPTEDVGLASYHLSRYIRTYQE